MNNYQDTTGSTFFSAKEGKVSATKVQKIRTHCCFFEKNLYLYDLKYQAKMYGDNKSY